MPHARQEPYDEDVAHVLGFRAAASAKRNVNVVAEETRQRDVPAPPKVLNRHSLIRVVEVLEIAEAHHAAHADGHVGIRREVQVDLQAEEQHAQPVTSRRLSSQAGIADGQQRIGNRSARVGQNGLFRQTDAEASHAVVDVVFSRTAFVNLFGNRLVAHNRASDALMEERRIEQQLPITGLRINFPAVDIDHVRNELERVERDADGQHDFGNQLGHTEYRLEVGAEESQVFEDAEHAQQHNTLCNKPELSLAWRVGPLDEQGEPPAGKRVAHEQHEVARTTPRIEDKRGNEQHHVAVSLIDHVVDK